FCFVAVFFDASFEQSSTSLTFFTEQCINRTVPMLNYTIPTPIFQSVDPIFVVILAPILVALFAWLATKNREPNVISKLGIGMIIMSIGFFMLCIPGKMVDSGIRNISMLWIIGIYMFQALSELFISPVGLSAVSKLSPVKFATIFMGVWFVESAIAEVLAGWLSTFYPDSETGVVQNFLGIFPVNNFVTFFLIFAISTLILGIIVFIFKNKITA
ncbi:MAG: MFS transporter, partial [archaeon]|nr:MFS transporter [archaeon]